MNRFLILLLFPMLALPTVAPAQDAATEEKLNQLNGKIEDLIAAQEAQRKRISELSKEIDSLREQAGKPTGDYASKEDMKRLADAIKDVDKKRLEDNERIHGDLMKLSELIKKSAGSASGTKRGGPSTSSEGSTSEKSAGTNPATFEPYVVQPGDTLDAIVQAYKTKGVKITVQQIMKANPGLVPEKMHVGQKIIIPAP